MTDESKRLQIVVLAANTLQDRKRSSWGATTEHIAQALQKHCGDVHFIDPVYSKGRFIGKVIHKLSRIFLKKNYLYNHTFSLARRCSKVIAARLAGHSYDVIVAPSGGTEIAFLETGIPIVLIEDANFALLHDYYADYSNLLKRSAYQVDALEKAAIRRASLVLHPSEKAVQATIDRYGADEQKVRAVPFGANFENVPSLESVQAKKKSERCQLLFLGVDWERKGGDIAFQTLLKLEEMGIRAHLIICGCRPPAGLSHERMTVIPFLNKSDPAQRAQLERLFETSDFFFLPTRSECYGMVFCEASAYGLPVITTNTGGVSGAVTDGQNGFMLAPGAEASDYAEVIAKVYRDDQRYADLVRSSRVAFDERLNWDAWGKSLRKLLVEMLTVPRNTPGEEEQDESLPAQFPSRTTV
jgi:glycosyltransferase involved in cell wall biosynthesis